MNESDFYQLKEQLSAQQCDMFLMGESGSLGLWMDYRNNKGERKQFCVINITSSPFPGCFEADCFSGYQFIKIEEQIGFCEDEMAVTSHRTFKIANIISAEICHT